jgi:hypothetical protein
MFQYTSIQQGYFLVEVEVITPFGLIRCLCRECYEAFVVYNFLMFLARYCALAEPPASLRRSLMREHKLDGFVPTPHNCLSGRTISRASRL